MDLIAQLKQNEKPFGLMSEEMQEAMDGIPRKELESWHEHVWIDVAHGSYPLHGTTTYRLRADYTVEDEYELCEITEREIDTAGLVLRFDYKGSWGLGDAPGFPNFAGYLYEDGKICDTDLRFLDKAGSDLWGVTLEQIKSGTAIPIRPTHVVFKKG